MATTYDAIVVGSGACGGWAAMELSKAGMKVLMLEAGSAINPAKEFQHKFLYQMEYRSLGKPGFLRRYTGSERNYRIMLDSEENPYTTTPETVYRWSRSRCLGGRTLHWARHRPHGGLRVQGSLPRRLWHGLAGHVRGHEALLRQD